MWFLRMLGVATAFAVAAPLLAGQGVGIGRFGDVRSSATDKIEVKYLDKDGNEQTVKTDTGAMTRWNKKKKTGTDASAKATKIADAINAAGKGALNAVASEHVVTVGTKGDNKGVTSFKVVNSSKQKRDKPTVSTPGKKIAMAVIGFTGVVTGWDTGGDLAEVSIGTGRGEVTLLSIDAPDLPSLTMSLASELLTLGADVQFLDPTTLLVPIEVADAAVLYGCTDAGIEQEASVFLVEESSEEEPQ